MEKKGTPILAINKNILIICRDINDMNLLNRIKADPEMNYIVASDNIAVQETCKRFSWVNEVCWIEEMETLYSVSDDVIAIIKVINEWFKALSYGKIANIDELLFWIQHVEGGETTQRIQDVLLLIRSYLHLFDVYNISEVKIIRNPDSLWEDDVLLLTALNRGISVNLLGSHRVNVIVRKLKLFIKNVILREPYYVSNILRVKLMTILKKNKVRNNEILFQLCSSSPGHIENIIPIMKEVKKKGYNPIALCWMASSGAKKVREDGISAEELEEFVPNSSLWQSGIHMIRIWKKATSMKISFIEHPSLNYKSVPFGKLLWPSIFYFIFVEFPQKYRLNLALNKYLSIHSPLAIKLWGGGTLTEGNLVLKYISKNVKPILMYWFDGVFDYPYESKFKHVDLFLTSGKSQENHLEKLGVENNRMVSVGSSRYDLLPDFIKENTQQSSRLRMNVPLTYRMYVLYTPATSTRGFTTVREQVLLTDFLLKFANNFQNTALLIKPHPTCNTVTLNYAIKRYSLPNVFLIDKNISPYHAINACDLLILKISTVGLEAMLLNRPVISVILNKEMRFRIYGEATENVTSIEELDVLLRKLENEKDFRFIWTKNMIIKGNKYCEEYMGKRQTNSSALSAEAIDRFITERRLKSEVSYEKIN
ncbi:MAG: CDP-glycerol glycerophosphotransferase family protein [Elusimicrobia bacterium]|nr:CDP-glycerol glycerophosphotransferase family protein [Candidatus Liberimonas magnetica]